MNCLERTFDIQPLVQADMTVHINGQAVSAAIGETVLSVIQSLGVRQIARVAEYVVPFMAGVYLLAAIIVLIVVTLIIALVVRRYWRRAG